MFSLAMFVIIRDDRGLVKREAPKLTKKKKKMLFNDLAILVARRLRATGMGIRL